MNKYQEALEILCTYADGNPSSSGEFVGKMLQEANDTLQELVEKATPKKAKVQTLYVEYQEPETFVVCPICEEEFYYNDCEKINYCPNCGQALDWSEEDVA